MPKLNSKRRKELIEHLTGNCECDNHEAMFDDDDTATLEKMDLDYLEKLAGNTDDDEEEDDIEDVEEDDDDEETTNNEEKPVKNSFKEEDLPAEVLEDLKFARNMKKQLKDQLIAKITSNEEGVFTKKELEAMSVDNLQKIASYIPNTTNNEEEEEETPRRTPRFPGNRPVKNQGKKKGKQVNNEEEEEDYNSEPLSMPTINWETLSPCKFN